MKSPIDQMAHVENYERKVRLMFKRGTPQVRHVPRETYNGEELKRDYSLRIGAFDAFDHCQSLRDGVLYPYVGPKPQCVGKPVFEPAALTKGGIAE